MMRQRGAMPNLLLLSAGRRVSLLKGFQQASRAFSGLRVLAADATPELSAACRLAEESFRLPRVGAPDFASALCDLCKREDVAIVVPTIDPELPVLAALSESFVAQGIDLVVSSPALIDQFGDKRLTAAFFKDRGLETPTIYPRGANPFPVFVKPFDGSLSAGTMLIGSAEEMTPSVRDNPKNIFCEFIDPKTHTEFTCDLYYDRSGALKCAVPRQRIEVRGGEVAKARTAKNEIVALLFECLGQIAGARGPLTLQLFRNDSSGRIVFNEVNARFGGGYPLTRCAGADFQTWLLREYLRGEKIETHHAWADGLIMLRYDAEVIVEG